MSDEPSGPQPGDPNGDDPPRTFRVRKIVQPAGGDDGGQRQVSRDETDLGWGDGPAARDDDWYRRERPPHHE